MNHSSDGFFRFRSESSRRLGAGLVMLILAAVPIPVGQAGAADGPLAPCGTAGAVPFPAFGDPPNGRNWHPGDIPPAWSPPACMPWATQPFTVLTALAGSVKF